MDRGIWGNSAYSNGRGHHAGFYFTFGILTAIGERAEGEEKSNMEYQGFQILEELCQRKKPEIICNTEKHYYAGEVISIEEVFRGEDADGRNLEVEVKEIIDYEGVSYISEYRRDVRQIVFQKAGVYQFKVKAQDKEKLCVTKWIEIPVDSRRGRK